MTKITRKTRRTLLGITALVAWGALLATVWETKRMAAKAPMALILKTDPPKVRIKVGKNYLFRGDYRETPIKIPLPAGSHKLKFIREGYVTNASDVQGGPGKTIPVETVLEKLTDIVTGSVTIKSGKKGKPVYVSVEHGFEMGETPIKVDELTIENEHLLVIYPHWPEQRDPLRCKFRVQEDKATKIQLRRLKSGTIRPTNCRTLRRKKQP